MTGLPHVLHKSILEYETALARAASGEQDSPGPWRVDQVVDRVTFNAWTVTVPAVWKIEYRAAEGAVLLHGDPSLPHGTDRGWFHTEINLALQQLGGRNLRRAFLFPSCVAFDIPGGAKTLDFAMQPRFQKGLGAPPLAVEVGHRSEKCFNDIKKKP